MKSYDGIFIFPPESAPEARKRQLKGVEDLFQKYQAQILEKVEWGKRPLGYAVRKMKEGYFILWSFQMETSKVAEFRHALNLQEELLKFMLTVKPVKPAKAVNEKARAAAPAKPAQQVGSAQ